MNVSVSFNGSSCEIEDGSIDSYSSVLFETAGTSTCEGIVSLDGVSGDIEEDDDGDDSSSTLLLRFSLAEGGNGTGGFLRV